ncbi:MAG: nitroreductase family protein [Clostridium perfringens]|nr:nitroreductase family protein [Clostridium perfringens]
MNSIIETIKMRSSLRKYKNVDISKEHLDIILECAMRAPTAGNMMAYSILVIKDEKKKKKLSGSCDNQTFIEKAPVLLVFLADFKKWYSYYESNDVKSFIKEVGGRFLRPSEGNLFLAMEDAMIAAQNTVIAAESLGIGSCYIGDIMENIEYNRDLFNLPEYVFPVTMLALGYYPDDYNHDLKDRFNKQFVIFEEEYENLDNKKIKEMFKEKNKLFNEKNKYGAKNYAQSQYAFKINSEFMNEMTRSVKEVLNEWNGEEL